MPGLWTAELHSPREPGEMGGRGCYAGEGRGGGGREGRRRRGTTRSSHAVHQSVLQALPPKYDDTLPPPIPAATTPVQVIIIPSPDDLNSLPWFSSFPLFAPSLHSPRSSHNDLFQAHSSSCDSLLPTRLELLQCLRELCMLATARRSL